MAKQMNVVGGGVRAFLQAGMRQYVHHHMIGRPYEAFNHTETRGPSRRVEHDFLHSEKVSNFTLERNGMGRVPNQRRRARAMHATSFDGFYGDRLYKRMR